MDDPESILLFSAIGVALAAVVAFGLFRLITVKGQAFKPIHYGRKWMAWMVLFGSMTTLPKFFRHLDANSFAGWVAVTIPLGILAFIAGWIYGMTTASRKEEEKNQTGADSIPSINLPHVSDEKDVQSKTIQEQGTVDFKPIDINTESSILTTIKKSIPKTELNDEPFFAQAWDEANDPNRTANKALWAKAFSISQGDEKKTQAKYIKLRVAQLRESTFGDWESRISTNKVSSSVNVYDIASKIASLVDNTSLEMLMNRDAKIILFQDSTSDIINELSVYFSTTKKLTSPFKELAEVFFCKLGYYETFMDFRQHGAPGSVYYTDQLAMEATRNLLKQAHFL